VLAPASSPPDELLLAPPSSPPDELVLVPDELLPDVLAELLELPDEFRLLSPEDPPVDPPEDPLENPDELALLPKGDVVVPPEPPQAATVSNADE
jgi:hypothetical protein